MSIFPKSTAADLLRGRVQLNLHLSFAKTDPAKKQWFREGEMLPLDGRRRNRYVVNHRIIDVVERRFASKQEQTREPTGN